jgi:hypothetical protein
MTFGTYLLSVFAAVGVGNGMTKPTGTQIALVFDSRRLILASKPEGDRKVGDIAR